MQKIFFTIFILLQFKSNFAFAEYRVFVLKITNTKTSEVKTINSTLDPEQYKSFYLIKPEESITYVNTWRCRGATRDYKALCEGPAQLKKKAVESSQDVQKKS